MKKIGIAAVVVLVAAACSSSSTDTTTTTAGGAGATTTSSAAPGTTAATTTTTVPVASSGLADCVIGTWELDSQHFFDQLADGLTEEGVDSELKYLGGAYQIAAMPDGSFTSSRIDWSFGVVTDFGDLDITMNYTQEGTYTVDGGTMSTNIPAGGDPAEIEFSIDGVPFDIPGGVMPVEPPDASFDTAAPDCGDDTMSITVDGYTSIWNRVG